MQRRSAKRPELLLGCHLSLLTSQKSLEAVDLPVFAQHIDAIKPGSNTGYVLAESVKDAGAIGTLINHSEHQLKLADIDAIVQLCREKGLVSCVCANNPNACAAASALAPDIISIEPPELIGSGSSCV